MPQERLTAKFFLQDDASVKIMGPEDLHAILRRWHINAGTYVKHRRKFETLRYEEDPTEVIRELIDLARVAASGTQREPVVFVI